MKKVLIFILTNFLIYLQNLQILYPQNITENSLPLRAKNFININFPGDSIETVDLYQNGEGYEVKIKSGFNFIFYETGLWKSVRANGTNFTIPRSCIHKNMVNAIDKEYPNSKINYIERGDKKFFIILNNQTEIEISGYGLIINKRNIN